MPTRPLPTPTLPRPPAPPSHPISAPRRRAPALAAALALFLLAASASAAPSKQDVAKADRLFKEARTLMAQGKFDTACPRLEESEKLDPAPGTRYQLAVCYEATARPATALALFLEVADLAKAAGYKDKEKAARDKALALEPRVPRIVIEVPPARRPTGLTITRDGAPVEDAQYNRPILVDPGEYTIEATAPDRKPFKSTVTVKGEGTRVTVPISLALVAVDPSPPDTPPPPAPSTFGGQRIAAITVGALGLGGLVAGTIFGLQAKSTHDEAKSNPSLCPSRTACYPEGKARVDQARTDAAISTVTFVAGGVALAAGTILFITAPPLRRPSAAGKHSPYSAISFTPIATPDFAGFAAAGRF